MVAREQHVGDAPAAKLQRPRVVRVLERAVELGGEALELAGAFGQGTGQPAGDSVEHDIAGGNGAGIATALVLTGILADVTDLAAVFDEEKAWPDYITTSFSLR